MTYDEFTLKCVELAPSEIKELGLDSTYSWNHRWEPISPYYRKKYKETKFVLRVEWETGGCSGGSCWGGNPEPYTSRNPVADFKEFDQILEYFQPSLTFLQYKNLYNSLITEDSYSVNEYYGNHTDYAYKEIDLKKLYDYMKEKGWLQKQH